MCYTYVTDKAGVKASGKADVVGENITNDNDYGEVVRLGHTREYFGGASSKGRMFIMTDPDQLKERIAIDLGFLSETELTYVLSRVEACLSAQQLSPTGREIDTQEIP